MPDIRAHASSPWRYLCGSPKIFTAGGISFPIADEECTRRGAGEYMVIDGDFVIGAEADGAAGRFLPICAGPMGMIICIGSADTDGV